MYRNYNLFLATSLLAMVAGVLGLALWLQPLTGDLTRLGGFAENEYGWNAPQRVFEPPLAERGSLDRAYDIVVIGDSYSLRTTADRQTPDGGFWTDFLAAGTGLRIGVFDVDTTPVDALLASDAYRAHPPRLLVLELVERSLWFRLVPHQGACGAATNAIAADLTRAWPGTVPRIFQRAMSGGPAIDEAVDFVRKSLLRAMTGNFATDVVELKLVRTGLFSSRTQTDLLVYRDEFGKAVWLARDAAAMRCRLEQMHAEVERTGTTRFMFMMPPDKSSAYAAYVAPPVPETNTLEMVVGNSAVLAPRLDRALRAAISVGMQDVYLPNDTHWGSAGAEIAARVVMDTFPSPSPRFAETP